MSDNIASERIVGEHTVRGRRVDVHRLTWTNHPGLSFEVIDTETGDLLTEDESFDQYPTLPQLEAVIDAHAAQVEDGHNCFGAHFAADGYTDCDGIPL
ncbi:hypothetical protein ABT246_24520 [Streptomyces sp. NPDC001553]|uniref:hypothetical protein n=1 Tax=Streptomyces sp. NPDC001553 TaxID=3154385 RepID=UPI0033331123